MRDLKSKKFQKQCKGSIFNKQLSEIGNSDVFIHGWTGFNEPAFIHPVNSYLTGYLFEDGSTSVFPFRLNNQNEISKKAIKARFCRHK
jgi:hypothetical protein